MRFLPRDRCVVWIISLSYDLFCVIPGVCEILWVDGTVVSMLFLFFCWDLCLVDNVKLVRGKRHGSSDPSVIL